MRFGGGASGTSLHPLVVVAALVALICIIALPRRWAVAPLLISALVIPLGQVVVVGSVHLTVLRIITTVALCRWWRGVPNQLSAIDKAFLLWAIVNSACFVVLYGDSQALINRLGFLIDSLAGYFSLRAVVHDEEDVLQSLKVLVFVASAIAIVMVSEQLTHSNIINALGGLPGLEIRDGHVRSHGVFQHPLLAGTVGATLVPLFVGMWGFRHSRVLATVGIIAATTMTLTANVSTSLAAYGAGIVALCFWPIRRSLSSVRWALLLLLVALHLTMKAPVWALIGRLDLTGSSSSFHRYILVDNTIRHFTEWWLIGYRDYQSWGWDMWDLCDEYVVCCLSGGLVTLVLFVMIIIRGFQTVGRICKKVTEPRLRWMTWCLGATLFAHTIAYLGVSYFDQSLVAWYALLSMLSALDRTKVRAKYCRRGVNRSSLTLQQSAMASYVTCK